MQSQEELNQRLNDAAKAGDVMGVEQALEDGADALAEESVALWRAARNGHAECVRLLITASEPQAQKSRALGAAANWGHVECVRLLIPANDPLAVGNEGLNAAASARKNGHMEVAGMIEAFIESQALSMGLGGAARGPIAKRALQALLGGALNEPVGSRDKLRRG